MQKSSYHHNEVLVTPQSHRGEAASCVNEPFGAQALLGNCHAFM